jgi:hypothetical protein
MQGGGRGQQCTVLIMKSIFVCVCVCVSVCVCGFVRIIARPIVEETTRRRRLRSSSEARVHHPIFTALTPGADPAGYERSPARTNEDAINCSSALLRLLGSLLLKTHFISRHTVHHCPLPFSCALVAAGRFFFLMLPCPARRLAPSASSHPPYYTGRQTHAHRHTHMSQARPHPLASFPRPPPLPSHCACVCVCASYFPASLALPNHRHDTYCKPLSPSN